MIKCLNPEANLFLESLLKQINVNAGSPDATKNIEIIQYILGVIQTPSDSN